MRRGFDQAVIFYCSLFQLVVRLESRYNQEELEYDEAIKIVCSLTSDFVVQAKDFIRVDKKLLVISEYVPGKLRQLVKAHISAL